MPNPRLMLKPLSCTQPLWTWIRIRSWCLQIRWIPLCRPLRSLLGQEVR